MMGIPPIASMNWNGSQLKDLNAIWYELFREFNALPKLTSGSTTFGGSGTTVAVVFAQPQPDANYFVALGSQLGETIWWSTPTTSGFTLHSSVSGSVAVVNWILIR